MKIKNFTMYVATLLLVSGFLSSYASDSSISDDLCDDRVKNSISPSTVFEDEKSFVGSAQEEVVIFVDQQVGQEEQAQESEREVTTFADQQADLIQDGQEQGIQGGEEAVLNQVGDSNVEQQQSALTEDLDGADVDDYDYDYNQVCDNCEMDHLGSQESSYCRDCLTNWASQLVMFLFSAKNYVQEKYTSLIDQVTVYLYTKNKKLLDEPR